MSVLKNEIVSEVSSKRNLVVMELFCRNSQIFQTNFSSEIYEAHDSLLLRKRALGSRIRLWTDYKMLRKIMVLRIAENFLL